ncbi:MAG: hypothetical protein ACP5JH_04440 [Bacteroidota bacterium]
MMKLVTISAILVIIAGGILPSCELFQTRTPEPPTQASSSFVPPTSPQIVLQNFRNAIKERNTDNYVRCFADSLTSAHSYQFVPTEKAAAQYYGVFTSWNLHNERQYFDNIKSHLSSTSVPNLVLSNDRFEYLSSDSAIYSATYDLFIPHDVAGVPQTAHGNLQFTLGVDRNNMWMIYRWIDLSTGSEYTWSDFKGRFSY